MGTVSINSRISFEFPPFYRTSSCSPCPPLLCTPYKFFSVPFWFLTYYFVSTTNSCLGLEVGLLLFTLGGCCLLSSIVCRGTPASVADMILAPSLNVCCRAHQFRAMCRP